MTAVFVHGNPETPAVWEPLLAQLERRDTVALHLPGFGVPAPAGFGATKEEYVDWLIAELEAIGEPVDLVGHDWGGGFVLRVACLRPDLLRSWISDVGGMMVSDFTWHDLALVWQTPGAGEEFFAAMTAPPPEERAKALEGFGITAPAAMAFATALDDEMVRCILALYRSAIQPAMNEWSADAGEAAARPGLIISAANDPYTGGGDASAKAATATGAQAVVLPDVGHWWMLEDPAGGAKAIESFWASVK
ncbi:MAG: alpha/beta fold hydrolase [Acidimicrobiales bacterium]